MTDQPKKRLPKSNIVDREFEEMYAKMDIRPGIRAHAKKIAHVAFRNGFNYGVSSERAKG